jgi:hypothetical protein
MARTDARKGVWKAPAGIEARLSGVSGLEQSLSDADQQLLNRHAVNAIRDFPGIGRVLWGARTMAGAEGHASEYTYVPVRRLALFLEESLLRGTRWAVFEPNDEPLWAALRTSVGGFMHALFRRGAFQGGSPKDAYFVRCDTSTTTAADIQAGVVNILVGFAPLKPAEFIVLRIQQKAGQVQSSTFASFVHVFRPAPRWEDLRVSFQGRHRLRALVERRRRMSAPAGGIIALFSGASGTGKTMAAQLVANALGLDLYRIDLSGVVNKYIGETEKNLRRVFGAAEESGAILFFDEADVLFGRRTEVEDDADRYANLEVSYLLERIRAYNGLVILASNLTEKWTRLLAREVIVVGFEE